jgi:hypothetical protein
MSTTMSRRAPSSILLCVCLSLGCGDGYRVQPARFGPEYVAAHRRSVSFEVPEVQELVLVVMSLTPTGRSDSNLLSQETPYAREVATHFGPSADDPLVARFDAELQRTLFRGSRYSRLKMDAVGFVFDGERIVPDGVYDHLNWDDENYLTEHVSTLEGFARRTRFREFFAANRAYYDGLVELAKKQMPVEEQWSWLEREFPERYDHYRITFSPLVEGSHSTNRFEGNGFRQSVMFICGPWESAPHSPAVVEGLMTRVVFTEIDHNYVNPVTELHREAVERAFADRASWVRKGDADDYGAAYAVFNEYMTWAVFTLYCRERFEPADFAEIRRLTTRQMVERRGFVRFAEFDAELLRLREESPPGRPVHELFGPILDWCAAQSAR